MGASNPRAIQLAVLILLTVLDAVVYEISRRRAERQAKQETAERAGELTA